MIGLIKISRSTKELLIKIKHVQDEYLKEYGEEISLSKLSKKIGVEKEEIIFALESKNKIESIDEQLYDENSELKINQIKDNKDETNSLINKMCINKLIKELKKREQEIIILRYYKDQTQKEVGEKLGISQVQVSRIEKKILLDMRNKLKA